MSVYKKLHKIQSLVNGLGKDKTSGQYGYVSGAKVLEFVRPLMNEYSLILKQEILSIDNERQDYMVNAKRWENVDGQNKQVEYQRPKSEILSKVMMKFTWIDVETGEKDENLFGANGQNDWEKGLGSALTYAERYFILKYFHIPTDEDDIDNELRKKIEDEKRPEVKVLKVGSAAWKQLIVKTAKGEKITKEELKKYFDIKEVEKDLETLNIL
ncbi:ERF family protein [Chryseobacterium arthrosphaerae]|uniref:ERF family protein n=1 Tax=Chryseobacterium arthrosphaerae TaxID=651561 RepID=A0ABU7R2T5_9FLAO